MVPETAELSGILLSAEQTGPVILAKQRRASRAKIAPELCDKGYNSFRDEYYYGVKLHTFAARYTGTLPRSVL